MNATHRAARSVVVAVVLGASCGGSTGPQGPAGSPADRANIYCRYSNAVLQPHGNMTTTMTCDTAVDLPWEGGCYAPDLPSGYYLANGSPLNWDKVGTPAGWTCTWAAWDNAPGTLNEFGGNAVMCCYSMK